MVEYEWIVEETEDGEVVDTEYFTTYPNARSAHSAATANGRTVRLALMRDDPFGSREWAYESAGLLPHMFADAEGDPTRKVPQKYLMEFARG
jgi:hypothetical protein